jgi:hypothetical protein
MKDIRPAEKCFRNFSFEIWLEKPLRISLTYNFQKNKIPFSIRVERAFEKQEGEG